MKIVIKLGGTLLDNAESRKRIAGELSAVHAAHTLVVVHGGESEAILARELLKATKPMDLKRYGAAVPLLDAPKEDL